MIFLTVGTQLPFDRLIQAVDDWAGSRQKDVFAQIGPSSFVPRYITTISDLEPQEFEQKIREATAIISHAGMGTILTALQLGKPILIMPRLAKFGEHRNDHQLSTTRQLQDRPGILVAMNEAELCLQLEALDHVATYNNISDRASDELINGIQAFISSDDKT